MPLITADTFNSLVETAIENEMSACVLTAVVENPFGYGRIIRDADGSVSGIVEQRDATEEQKLICEVNTSIYCFKIPELLDALTKVNSNNAQGELYLTDTLGILRSAGKKVGACIAKDVTEAMGINDRVQLSEAERVMRRRINERIMREGVTLIDPDSTYIEPDVTVGNDTVIYPGTYLAGKTVIGNNCVLRGNNFIDNSVIGNGVQICGAVINGAKIGDNTTVGPYAFIRPESEIGANVRVGDFVEIKKSVIGDNTKVSHLTYVGDAEVGKNVNLGCGTVFANYDGEKKHRTTVGDNAFIGCNSNLVAPLEVGENAFVAAGSTVTENVEANDLCIARSRQTVKKGWVLENKKR